MKQVELEQVETELAALLEQALQGEDVIITQSDQPVLRLARISARPPRRKRGSAKGQIQIAPDFDAPLEDFKAYME
jgi:antitoxin (DNA-binding transcriptional repressor) of toxin-antitoxin stability system